MKPLAFTFAILFSLALTAPAQAAGSADANEQLCSKASFLDRDQCQAVANQTSYFDPEALRFCVDNKSLFVWPSRCLTAIAGKAYSSAEISTVQSMLGATRVSSYAILDALEKSGKAFAPIAPVSITGPVSSHSYTPVTANTPWAVERIRQGGLKNAEEALLSDKKAEIESFATICTNAGGEFQQEMNSSCSFKQYLDMSGNQMRAFECGATVVLRCE